VLPDFTSPVVIPAGSTYSFYVTVADLHLGTYIFYNLGTTVGTVYSQDQYMEIAEGYAMGYPFLGYSASRKWNGNVYYTVGSGATPPPSPPPTTPQPTKAPTPNPTSSPTSNPTTTPDLLDTLDPTESPTQSPVGTPTQSPVKATSSSTSIPTSSPTKSPVGPSTPTNTNDDNGNGDGSGAVTPPPTSSPTKKPTTSPTSSTPSSPTSTPTSIYVDFSDGPTLNQYLPIKPTESSSVKNGVYIGHFCILSALFIAASNYLSL